MDAQKYWRPTARRGQRVRGALLPVPPQPMSDARLNRFTHLLDTISEGERALAAAHRAVEGNDAARAEKELSNFLFVARLTLARAGDLPAQYIDLLGRTMARAMVARAAAWIEHSFENAPAEALRNAARADVEQVGGLPEAWLDGKTLVALDHLRQVLNIAPA